MFGYLGVEKEKLNKGEMGLYQTFMCGICISTKRLFSDYARAFISYDINFFNVLFHAIDRENPKIVQGKCVTSPFKDRPLLERDALTDSLAVSNVILNYYNLYDDVLDEKSVKKRAILRKYKREYEIAKGLNPTMDAAIGSLYEDLRALEAKKEKIFDKICHPFAQLSQTFAKITLGDRASNFMLDLCYNVGKWVYLIDALDDLDKDFKKGNFNPFINCFEGFVNARQFVRDNGAEIEFIFYTTLNSIAQNYNDLNLTKFNCILNNLIYDSMRNKTQTMLDKYRGEI